MTCRSCHNISLRFLILLALLTPHLQALYPPQPQTHGGDLARPIFTAFTMSTANPNPQPTLYFGYGSNLWLDQMRRRCPSSPYVGVARLRNYRWMINARGFANIVSSTKSDDVVYGLVYDLAPEDEEDLDDIEGVPIAYTKETMRMEFWKGSRKENVDVTGEAEEKELLVYIDRLRVVDDVPKEEYIHRMNMGIRDALKRGVPTEYVERVIRPFIAAEK